MFGQITELLVNILSELRQLNEREISWMKEVREKDKLTELRQDREWAYLQEQWKHQEGQEEVARERAHQYYETFMTWISQQAHWREEDNAMKRHLDLMQEANKQEAQPIDK